MDDKLIALIILIAGFILSWKSDTKVGFAAGLAIVWMFGSYVLL